VSRKKKMKVKTLLGNARKAAKLRGHILKRFKKQVYLDGGAYFADCKKCGKWVTVIGRPRPNEIGIGGPAMGLNCGGEIK
jgi:hypothetical protein